MSSLCILHMCRMILRHSFFIDVIGMHFPYYSMYDPPINIVN